MLSAPTSDELLANPIIKAALEQAWLDSLPNDPQRRHEEGGWIYMDVANGQISVRRAPSGYQSELELSPPAVVLMSVVVGKFHTHPNPSVLGWDPEPSDADIEADNYDGVPDLIVSDKQIFVSGPASRRNGLGGPAGYPL